MSFGPHENVNNKILKYIGGRGVETNGLLLLSGLAGVGR